MARGWNNNIFAEAANSHWNTKQNEFLGENLPSNLICAAERDLFPSADVKKAETSENSLFQNRELKAAPVFVGPRICFPEVEVKTEIILSQLFAYFYRFF